MSSLAEVAPAAAIDDWSRASSGSRALFERASRVSVSGVHHNGRGVMGWPYPLYIERAEGAYKWDVDGNRFLDYGLGLGSLLLGHRHPAVVEAVQQEYMPGAPGASHRHEIEWAETVNELVPSAEKVRFVASGTEATMLAFRIARAYTGKPKIARFIGHYHGWHDYAMLGFRPPFDEPVSAGIPAGSVTTTVPVRSDDDCAELESALAGGDIAAVVLEPSGASFGTVPIAPGFGARLRDITERHGVLLIFDEVITGFRYSPGGVQARDGIRPDLTTLAKILCGGFMGGAVTGKAEILEVLRPGRAAGEPYVFHNGTFNGHPVSAVAGVATLREVKSGAAIQAADQHAAGLRAGLNEILQELSIRGFSYGESSVFHLYLEKGDGQSANGVALSPDTLTPEQYLGIPHAVVSALAFELRRRGVDLMSYSSGLTSCTHGERELDLALTAFQEVLRELRDRGTIAAA